MAFNISVEARLRRGHHQACRESWTPPRRLSSRRPIEKVAEAKPKRLVFDVSELEFMASAGLRVLIFAKQKMGAGVSLYVIGSHGPVLNTLTMSGFPPQRHLARHLQADRIASPLHGNALAAGSAGIPCGDPSLCEGGCRQGESRRFPKPINCNWRWTKSPPTSSCTATRTPASRRSFQSAARRTATRSSSPWRINAPAFDPRAMQMPEARKISPGLWKSGTSAAWGSSSPFKEWTGSTTAARTTAISTSSRSGLAMTEVTPAKPSQPTPKRRSIKTKILLALLTLSLASADPWCGDQPCSHDGCAGARQIANSNEKPRRISSGWPHGKQPLPAPCSTRLKRKRGWLRFSPRRCCVTPLPLATRDPIRPPGNRTILSAASYSLAPRRYHGCRKTRVGPDQQSGQAVCPY